jgi:hypothetical protein
VIDKYLSYRDYNVVLTKGENKPVQRVSNKVLKFIESLIICSIFNTFKILFVRTFLIAFLILTRFDSIQIGLLGSMTAYVFRAPFHFLLHSISYISSIEVIQIHIKLAINIHPNQINISIAFHFDFNISVFLFLHSLCTFALSFFVLVSFCCP